MVRENINQDKEQISLNSSSCMWDALYPLGSGGMHFSPRNDIVTFMNVWEPENAICVMEGEGYTVCIKVSFVSVWAAGIVDFGACY